MKELQIEFGRSNIYLQITVEAALAVPSVKRSLTDGPVIVYSMFFQPVIKGHLPYKVSFCLSLRWPLDTGLIVTYKFTPYGQYY